MLVQPWRPGWEGRQVEGVVGDGRSFQTSGTENKARRSHGMDLGERGEPLIRAELLLGVRLPREGGLD